MTFLGPLLIALIVGGIFFCTVLAFAACALAGREPELDHLDFDNAHPDGFVSHFAADKREVR